MLNFNFNQNGGSEAISKFNQCYLANWANHLIFSPIFPFKLCTYIGLGLMFHIGWPYVLFLDLEKNVSGQDFKTCLTVMFLLIEATTVLWHNTTEIISYTEVYTFLFIQSLKPPHKNKQPAPPKKKNQKQTE